MKNRVRIDFQQRMDLDPVDLNPDPHPEESRLWYLISLGKSSPDRRFGKV